MYIWNSNRFDTGNCALQSKGITTILRETKRNQCLVQIEQRLTLQNAFDTIIHLDRHIKASEGYLHQLYNTAS
jgi:hypothetical protein